MWSSFIVHRCRHEFNESHAGQEHLVHHFARNGVQELDGSLRKAEFEEDGI